MKKVIINYKEDTVDLKQRLHQIMALRKIISAEDVEVTFGGSSNSITIESQRDDVDIMYSSKDSPGLIIIRIMETKTEIGSCLGQLLINRDDISSIIMNMNF